MVRQTTPAPFPELDLGALEQSARRFRYAFRIEDSHAIEERSRGFSYRQWSVEDVLRLRRENEALQRENAELRQRVAACETKSPVRRRTPRAKSASQPGT